MQSKGFSLLELMITLVVGGILIALAVPAMSQFTVQMRVDNEIGNLNRILVAARNSAINSGFTTTVCPLDAANACTKNWHLDISVFSDIDNDQVYEPADGEQLIKVKNLISTNDKLTYNVNSDSLTYSPEGVLLGVNNGTFTYCPNGFDQMARGIIVSKSGRARKTTDTNDDGIDNGAGGNLSCN